MSARRHHLDRSPRITSFRNKKNVGICAVLFIYSETVRNKDGCELFFTLTTFLVVHQRVSSVTATAEASISIDADLGTVGQRRCRVRAGDHMDYTLVDVCKREGLG